MVPVDDDALKRCPFCKERVREEAVKCRYCGEWLNRPEPVGAPHVPDTESAARLPDPLGPPAKPVSEGKVPAQKTKKEIPVKVLHRISAALLCGCVILLAVGLARLPWSTMSPAKQQQVFEKLFAGIGKVVIGGLLVCWAEKRKGYRLLWFSAVCALFSALGAYFYCASAHQTRQANKEWARNLSEFYTNTIEFFRNGATGNVPNLKLTGNATDDMARRYLNEFMQVVAQISERMDGLQKRNVFDDVVLTNAAELDSEVRKRIAGGRIIDEEREKLRQVVEGFRAKVMARTVSGDDERGMVRGLDGGIQATSDRGKEMFDLMQKREQSELDFLRFMASTRSDYYTRDGKILFASGTNRQTYDSLSRAVVAAQGDCETWGARQLQKGKAALDGLR
jgi:hypothetical protein